MWTSVQWSMNLYYHKDHKVKIITISSHSDQKENVRGSKIFETQQL